MVITAELGSINILHYLYTLIYLYLYILYLPVYSCFQSSNIAPAEILPDICHRSDEGRIFFALDITIRFNLSDLLAYLVQRNPPAI